MEITAGAASALVPPDDGMRRVHVAAVACLDRVSDRVLSVVGTDVITGAAVVAWPAAGSPLEVGDLDRATWELAAARTCVVPAGVPADLPVPLALLGPCLAAARLAVAPAEQVRAYDVAAFLLDQDRLLGGLPIPAVRRTAHVPDTIASAFGAALVDGVAQESPARTTWPAPTSAQVEAALRTIGGHAWRFQPAITAAYTSDEWRSRWSRAEDGLVAVVVA